MAQSGTFVKGQLAFARCYPAVDGDSPVSRNSDSDLVVLVVLAGEM